MQTTKFDPNFSIFDKMFIPVISDLFLDMEPLEDDQFWPIQHKSSNKLKKIEYKKISSSTLNENDTIYNIKNDSTKCNPLEIKSICNE
ncbi:18925_t:CDS:2, partial [Funneliformis geosporum]